MWHSPPGAVRLWQLSQPSRQCITSSSISPTPGQRAMSWGRVMAALQEVGTSKRQEPGSHEALTRSLETQRGR
jgi:hypothetical protein